MSKLPPEGSRTLRGMLLMMAAVALFVVLDSISKYLTRHYPVLTVVWARYAFHTLLIVVALAPRLGSGLVRTARPGAQIVRGLLLAISSIFFVGSLKYLSLAEASAIAFMVPIFVTLLAVVLLKEKVEFACWVAILCAFAGVIIISRPGSGLFTWASLLPLGTATCFATYQIQTRRLAGLESPYTSIFYAGLVGTVLLCAAPIYDWTPPQNTLHAFLFVAIGIVGGLSHLILIKAYDFAPASRLAPFSYTQLIWVTFAGYLLFDDFPDRWSLIGIAILMASGIYTAMHQRKIERRQRERAGLSDPRR